MDIGSHTQVSHTQRNLSGEADEELLQHTAGHLLGLHSVCVWVSVCMGWEAAYLRNGWFYKEPV